MRIFTLHALLTLPLMLCGCEELMGVLDNEGGDSVSVIAITTSFDNDVGSAPDDLDVEALEDLPLPERLDEGVSSRVYMNSAADMGAVTGASLALTGCELEWTYEETVDGRYDAFSGADEPCAGPFAIGDSDAMGLPVQVPVDFAPEWNPIWTVGAEELVIELGEAPIDQVIAAIIELDGNLIWTNQPNDVAGWSSLLSGSPPETLVINRADLDIEPIDGGTVALALVISGLAKTDGSDLEGVSPDASIVLGGRTKLGAVFLQFPAE